MFIPAQSLTRAARLRRFIIGLEVVVLVLVLATHFGTTATHIGQSETSAVAELSAQFEQAIDTPQTASTTSRQNTVAHNITVLVSQQEAVTAVEILGRTSILKHVQLLACENRNIEIMLEGELPLNDTTSLDWLRQYDFAMAFAAMTYHTTYSDHHFALHFANGSTLRVEQTCLPSRDIVVYVNEDYSVNIMDSGTIYELGHFAECNQRTLRVDQLGDLPVATSNTQSLGSLNNRLLVIPFRVSDYYVVNTTTTFDVHFDNGSTLSLKLHCAPITIPMVIYVLDGYVYVADYQNNDPQLLMPLADDCLLTWETENGVYATSFDGMAHLEGSSRWFPEDARIAFRFDAVEGIRVSHLARGQAHIQHGAGVFDLALDCD